MPGTVSHLNSFLYLFIIFKFLAVLGLNCFMGFSPVVATGDLL